MSRLIDAVAFDERVRIAVGFSEEEVSKDFKDGVSTTLLLLKTQPTADAVDVVRCIDCKWWKCDDDTKIIKYGECTHPSSAVRKNCLPNETWFCADGERMEVKSDGHEEAAPGPSDQ